MFLSLAVGICVRNAGYLLDLAPAILSGLAALAMAVTWRRGSVVAGFLVSLVLAFGMIGVVLQQMFKNWRF